MSASKYDTALFDDTLSRQLNDNGIEVDADTLVAVSAGMRRLARTYAAPGVTPPQRAAAPAVAAVVGIAAAPAGGARVSTNAAPTPGGMVKAGTEGLAAEPAVAAEPAIAVERARPLPTEFPLTIAGLRAWIQEGRISPAEALDIQDRRFRAGDADIHSVARFCTWAAPANPALPLAGIGLAHKDNIASGQFQPGNGLAPMARDSGEVAAPRHSPTGARSAAASASATSAAAAATTSAATAGHSVPPIAPVIAQLSAQGATQLATLVMAERACGATSENRHYPPVVNPLDAMLFVGGSSSGSAAAVAAGFCYGALGTDTAGSVRIPAASCGLLGFKPSRGVLSGDGVAPLAPSLDTVGLLTRSAADMQAIYGLAAPSGYKSTATPLRIANTLPLARMESSVADTLDAFLDQVGHMDLGLGKRQRPDEQVLQLLREIAAYGETLFYYEAAQQHAAALREQPSSMNTVARQLCTQGFLISQGWYTRARHDRQALRDAFVAQHFAHAHLLLMPAFSVPVPEQRRVSFDSPDFDAAALLEVFRWMMPANYLDLPALVMPVGTDRHGRPVSVQLLGRPGSEAHLLAFANQFEVESGNPHGLFGLGAPHMQS